MQNDLFLYFDEQCVLCNRSVYLIYRLDRSQKFTFVSLQSEFAKKRIGQVKLAKSVDNSFVFEAKGKYYQESTAALGVLKHLPYPWKLGLIFWLVPRFFRDYVYRFIAKKRFQWFGTQESCLLINNSNQHRFILK